MDLKADYKFPAPPERVWDLLMDPKAIASCVPGVQEFETTSDDHYHVILKAGVAAVSGTFEGTVAIVDKQPHSSYRLIVDGRGQPGFVKGESVITLTPDQDGVLVHVTAALQVGGLVARVGQRLLGATARLMMDKFFACMQKRM